MPDISYGVYIYGWMVQQSLVLLGIAERGFGTYLAASIGVTTVLAALSYYLIERPCLRLKNALPRVPITERGRAPAAQ